MSKLSEALGDNNPFAGMSPTDALKFRMELENRKVASPEQASANRRKTLSEVLGMLPIVGNAMSAYDAYGSAGEAKQAFQSGDNKRGALAAALTGLSTAGALAVPGAGKLARSITKEAPRTLNIFAGPTAKTADSSALSKAQEMAKAGASRDDIWRDTGWFQGVDGKWRFEIDDSMSADISPMGIGLNSFSGRADSMLYHPGYYSAYPDAKGMSVQYLSHVQDGVPLGKYYSGKGFYAAGPKDSRHSVALHELQHDAQGREGFAPGGSYQVLGPDIYGRLAGEVEARNVQARRKMSQSERRATAPWLTQDVPDDLQVVRFK